MGIGASKYLFDEFDAKVKKDLRLIEQLIIRRLKFLGERCVNEARLNGDYTNRSGNLRNSIGYVVIANGIIIDENFEETVSSEQATDKATARDGARVGQTFGRGLARQIAKERFGQGFALVVVAGKNYAAYLESKYHKNVLKSAELLAQAQFPAMMRQLRASIKATR